MNRSNRLFAVLASLAFSQAASAALLIDFNTTGAFANNFSTSQTAGLIIQSASGGLNNSGHVNLSGLAPESGHTQIWTMNTAFSPTLSAWTAEFYLKGSEFANFGVTTEAAPRHLTGFLVNDTATAYLPQFSMVTGSNLMGIYDMDSIVQTSATTVPLTSGWYRYQLSANYLGAGNYNVTATVHTADATGTLLQQIGTVTTSINNPDLAAAPQAYLYLNVDRVGESIDNFSTTAVIPEPATTGLALVGATLLVLRRRVR